MPPEDIMPGSPSDCLRHAYSDLELARVVRTPMILLEGLCFHAQQAAEKALKAVLIANGIPFERIHNLKTLLDLLPQGTLLPPKVQDAASLTDYAVSRRYPGDFEPITEEEHLEAVQLAEAVVHWAERIISKDRETGAP
ncbi:MAG: HEPN domain-containing protein [Candidatus Latescibacteria bacterium]|nr:HEPN domain-containing protein [Candidatus Latescibacterota bacterium]